MEWFKAGGWGMFAILFFGVAAIAVGLRAAQEPTLKRLTILRHLPTLVVVTSLFTFGTNLWAVNVHLTNDAFVKARGIGSAELPFIAMIGLTEAGQALTLGGLLAGIVVALRLVAEVRHARVARVES